MDIVNWASAAEAIARRKERRPGVCIYFRDALCNCDILPRCPRWTEGFCVNPDCSEFQIHYQQPKRFHFGEWEAFGIE